MVEEFVDYYAVLGVPRTASTEEIEAAGRKAIKRAGMLSNQPDRLKRQKGENDMAQAQAAMNTLTDEAKRKAYDATYDRNKAAAEKETQEENDAAKRQTTANSTGDFLKDASDYMERGQWRNAFMAAQEATRLDPKNPRAWLARGQAAYNLNDYASASFALSQADKLDRDNDWIICALGEIADAEGKSQEAESYFRRAYQLMPNNSYYGGRIAWALSDQGKIDEALTLCVGLNKKFAGSDYIRNLYVNVLINDIEKHSRQMPGGTYVFTAKTQVEHAKKRLAEIDSIGVPEGQQFDFTRKLVEQHRKYVEQCSRRKFIWPGFAFYVRLAVIWFVVLFVMSIMNLLDGIWILVPVVLTVGLIWYAIEKTFPSQLSINSKVYEEA